MSVVTSKYRMTMDSGVEDAIIVHLERNQDIKFTLCGHGLYCFETTLDPWRRLKRISPEIKQLINIKAPLQATYLSPMLPPIKNILPNAKLTGKDMMST